MPMSVESTPPPRIGKIGPYTVFITPPATPTTPGSGPVLSNSPKSVSHNNSPQQKATPAGFPTPSLRTPVQIPVQSPYPSPAPVQAPPSQFYPTKPPKEPHSTFGFFWDAVAKVQNAHASLDEHVAYWFGLNQSKYQWALDDYYENKGASLTDVKANGVSGKAQSV